jgi:hypothetical protein
MLCRGSFFHWWTLGSSQHMCRKMVHKWVPGAWLPAAAAKAACHACCCHGCSSRAADPALVAPEPPSPTTKPPPPLPSAPAACCTRPWASSCRTPWVTCWSPSPRTRCAPAARPPAAPSCNLRTPQHSHQAALAPIYMLLRCGTSAQPPTTAAAVHSLNPHQVPLKRFPPFPPCRTCTTKTWWTPCITLASTASSCCPPSSRVRRPAARACHGPMQCMRVPQPGNAMLVMLCTIIRGAAPVRHPRPCGSTSPPALPSASQLCVAARCRP